MNIQHMCLVDFPISSFRQSLISSLNEKRHVIAAIVSLALACLVAGYFLSRCWRREEVPEARVLSPKPPQKKQAKKKERRRKSKSMQSPWHK